MKPLKLKLVQEHKHSLQYKGEDGSNIYLMKVSLGGEKPTEITVTTEEGE